MRWKLYDLLYEPVIALIVRLVTVAAYLRDPQAKNDEYMHMRVLFHVRDNMRKEQ